MTSKIKLHFSFLLAIILLVDFSRIIPHMPNFSPLDAIGLFGAACFYKKWKAFLILIAATWLSDLFINNLIYVQCHQKFIWFYLVAIIFFKPKSHFFKLSNIKYA
ncbi:MAG: hypothetical protein MK105_15945 [Crocinitomicaceae bacterium]|nr:hypothetical protein [Crocinitomicaceae bacterium]